MLTPNINNLSILNLNSVLLESPALLLNAFARETLSIICQGVSSKDVSFPFSICIFLADRLGRHSYRITRY